MTPTMNLQEILASSSVSPLRESLPFSDTRDAYAKKQAEIVKTVAVPPKRIIVAKARSGTVLTVNSNHIALMIAAGIDPSDFQYVEFIINAESGWRSTAANRSGAYGLPQSLPGNKMETAGSDWRSNPITQLIWANQYASSRYGSWAAAASFWKSHRYW